jgi:hypothetical protein
MLDFLKQRFFGSQKTSHRGQSVRPTLEEFESRFLPNAGPLFAGTNALGFNGSAQFGAADPSNMGQQSLTATLTGATGSGSASFSSNSTAGTNSLVVNVSGLNANSTYTVQIGGATAGQITTNANGSGQLSSSNISTSVASGSAITVLDPTGAPVLSGTFAASGCSSGSSSGTGSSGTGSIIDGTASSSTSLTTDASTFATDLMSGNLSGALAALEAFETYLSALPSFPQQEQQALTFLDQVFSDLG